MLSELSPRRWKYLERISVPGALRYGIDGLPAGVVSEHEAQHARTFLASKLASKNKNNGANDIRTEKEGS